MVYNWLNEFGVTFSPCCKWVLIQTEGERWGARRRDGGVREAGRERRWVCVGWGPMGGGGWGGSGGNHSSGNGSAVKEGPDCIGTACEREQHAQPNQSHIRERVLLSASNGPLDNHTGTKLLYLTLIAKTVAPPPPPLPHLRTAWLHQRSPHHLPAYSQDPFLNGIYNQPSSISMLIVILRLSLCVKRLVCLDYCVYRRHICLGSAALTGDGCLNRYLCVPSTCLFGGVPVRHLLQVPGSIY